MEDCEQQVETAERRNAERELQQSQALLRMASRLGRLGAWRLDLEPKERLTWSDEVRAIHEVPSDYTPNFQQAIYYYAPEWRAAIFKATDDCIQCGTPFDLELQIITAKQRLVWVRAIGEAVRNSAGKIVSIQGAFQDISDRRATQERLVEQAALLDSAHDGILVRDLFDRIIYWNKGAERIYGYTAAEALGKSARRLLQHHEAEYNAATAVLLEKGDWQGEFKKRAKDGRELHVEVRWTLVRDEAARPKSILSINTDVTERRGLETQFFRAQRLESIGTLAGGIAHDLNNILAPILMATELLRMKAQDAETQGLVDTLTRSARRGADLVKQVLSFARGVEGERVAVNPRHIVRELQKIARETFPKNIVFEAHLDRQPLAVMGDPTQLHQVLMNLCVNARDAMPKGGTIRVRVEETQVDEILAGLNPDAKPGPYVLITVADTGTGIPLSLREKIFEPFFTTKEPGQGTGLGLSTSLAITRSHGGFLLVESEEGKGSQFKVYLPAAAQTAVEEVERGGAIPRGNGELILVIDDEEAVRRVVARTLEAHGYKVALAANGAEGISLYSKLRDDVAMVITDMAMPVMDGASAILALRSLNPDLKIVASSGLATEAGVRSGFGGDGIAFVGKPYTAGDLLQVVARQIRG